MKSKKVFILFPNQLFKDISLLKSVDKVILIEEYLFFSQYKFHKQKLVFHRASMKQYEFLLTKHNINVEYVQTTDPLHDIRKLIPFLSENGIEEINYYDVCDNYLSRRIIDSSKRFKLKTTCYPTYLFINTLHEIEEYFQGRVRYSQTDFYAFQRKKLNILVDDEKKPLGGKWSFDAENRLKYPKDKIPPIVSFPTKSKFYDEAIDYVESNFVDNLGIISKTIVYPITHEESEKWLNDFLQQRMQEFGDFEDAIAQDELILNHSVLTPMLNIGLLLPMQIIKTTIEYAQKNEIPINSLEGFIRQIIGWREFIRAMYILKGTQQRTLNFWKFDKKIPCSFYEGNTGIKPIDKTIKKVYETAYCHHIERLMVLGNYMVLNEFNPNAVYKWFMESFIDAYDWVMVPNVYGMSQFADGGIMSTKPYISGSSYLLKMSDYKKEGWCEVWDALFWRFMHTHRNFFLKNPRLGMLIKTFDKMDEAKKEKLLSKAKLFLNSSM
jgi:deoxyribodipyrimidine photolyase-related protein